MVTALVDSLGKIRPKCFARSLLFQATDSLDAGDVVKAAVQLREAANRYLVALCEVHDCTPRKKLDRTPAAMNRALRRKLKSEHGAYRWLADIIDMGNRAAHCKPVDASLVETGIGLLHLLLDYSPEIVSTGREGVR